MTTHNTPNYDPFLIVLIILNYYYTLHNFLNKTELTTSHKIRHSNLFKIKVNEFYFWKLTCKLGEESFYVVKVFKCQVKFIYPAVGGTWGKQ